MGDHDERENEGSSEASLATRPSTGETLETERLKARHGEMLSERELLESGRTLSQKRSRR